MTRSQIFKLITLTALYTALLSGCGGGGSSYSSSGSSSSGSNNGGGNSYTIPTGIYSGTGTFTGSYSFNGAINTFGVNPNLLAIVTSSGGYQLFSYTPRSPNLVSQIDQGSGTASNGDFVNNSDLAYGLYPTFSNNNILYFPTQGNGVLSGNYTLNTSLSGTITYATGGAVMTFMQLAYMTTSTTTAAVANIAGTYSGNFYPNISPSFNLGAGTATLTIASNGTISGTVVCAGGYSIAATVNDPCIVSGNVTARSDVNAYNFSITFANNTTGGQMPSTWLGKTYTGMGYYNSGSQQLMFGVMASGTAFAFSN